MARTELERESGVITSVGWGVELSRQNVDLKSQIERFR